MNEKEKLFNEIINLKTDIQTIASIVQNDSMTVDYLQMSEWNELVNTTINKLNSLKIDVMEHYNMN